MTIRNLASALGLTFAAGEGGGDREITGGYAGDLLSWVMARAQSGDAWVTVMGNVNAVAVASLTDCACIILADGAELDPDAAEKAEARDVVVLRGDQSAFYIIKGIIENGIG